VLAKYKTAILFGLSGEFLLPFCTHCAGKIQDGHFVWVKRRISAAILYTRGWQNGALDVLGRGITQGALLVKSRNMGDGILSPLRHTLWALRDCELISAMGDAQNLQLLLVGRGLCCSSGDVRVCACVRVLRA
jgi:hypothetical protein